MQAQRDEEEFLYNGKNCNIGSGQVLNWGPPVTKATCATKFCNFRLQICYEIGLLFLLKF